MKLDTICNVRQLLADLAPAEPTEQPGASEQIEARIAQLEAEIASFEGKPDFAKAAASRAATSPACGRSCQLARRMRPDRCPDLVALGPPGRAGPSHAGARATDATPSAPAEHEAAAGVAVTQTRRARSFALLGQVHRPVLACGIGRLPVVDLQLDR